MIYYIVNKRSDWQYGITYIGALWQADIFLSAHDSYTTKTDQSDALLHSQPRGGL